MVIEWAPRNSRYPTGLPRLCVILAEIFISLANAEIVERREVSFNSIRALKECGDKGTIISDYRAPIIDLDLTHRFLGKENIICKILDPGIQDRALALG